MRERERAAADTGPAIASAPLATRTEGPLGQRGHADSEERSGSRKVEQTETDSACEEEDSNNGEEIEINRFVCVCVCACVCACVCEEEVSERGAGGRE